MCLDDGRQETPQADAVRAHDDGSRLSVLAEERAAQRLAVARTELEDVADLDTAFSVKRSTTIDASVSFPGSRNISHDVGIVVTRNVGIPEVEPVFIRSCHQIR